MWHLVVELQGHITVTKKNTSTCWLDIRKDVRPVKRYCCVNLETFPNRLSGPCGIAVGAEKWPLKLF